MNQIISEGFYVTGSLTLNHLPNKWMYFFRIDDELSLSEDDNEDESEDSNTSAASVHTMIEDKKLDQVGSALSET